METNRIPTEIIGIEPRIEIQQSSSANTEPTLSWEWVDQQKGIINWIIDNPTDEPIYVSILRNGYVFGEAFPEVYLYYNLSSFYKTTKPPEKVQYTLALVKFVNSVNVAFVFYVQPKQLLKIREGGFSQQPSNYKLLIVKPKKKVYARISYIPLLPVYYAYQTGLAILSLPSTYYIDTVLFEANEDVPDPFPRTVEIFNYFGRLIRKLIEKIY